MKKNIGKKRAPTESDVAARAGVSQSAVSRAFTPGASIAVETRAKILEIAEEVGYQPNLLARSLATKRSNIVALAISDIENPFYAQVVRELSVMLRETGRHILLYTTAADGTQDPALDYVLSYQVDALILTATTAPEKLARQCIAAGVPVVQINRESALDGVSTVRGQNEIAGRKIADFLFDAGHKTFGFVGGTQISGTSKTRQSAFIERLQERGVEQVQVVHGDYSHAGASRATRELLSSGNPPDAIFCASDYMAFATLEVAQTEFNLKVPQDLAVVGFDNVPASGRLAYDLTTYSQPAGALVEKAVAIVDEAIEKQEILTLHEEVKGELILRGSTRNSA